jgi:thiamine biosynthesis lipoprotein
MTNTKKIAEVAEGVRLAPHDLGGVRRFSHEAMATLYEVYAVHDDAHYAAQAAQAAFDLIDRLERNLSRFLPNSDITRIAHLDAGESTRVADSTMECLAIGRHMFDLTGGAFDVSIGTGLPSLELDADASVVRATERGTRIDLGGIGKGYAVDLVAELLEEWGLPAAFVHGGFSSVLALEAPANEDGWVVTLSDPAAPSTTLERLSVRQTALGASGVRRRDHIVDPRSGEPVRRRRAAWAAVPRPQPFAADGTSAPLRRAAAAAVTDALTTACMLLGHEEIEMLCRNSPGLEAWILEETQLLHFGAAASERSERASGAERAGEAASERRCRGVRGAKPLG